VAKDRPGLFSNLAGVLALNNINVLSAHIYTWRDGTAVDILKVTDPPDPIHPEETWQRLEKELTDIFAGTLSLDERILQKASPSLLSTAKRPVRPLQVVIDNDSSDFFTVIDVYSDDRIGFLYSVTRCLFDLRLDIRVAKIATKGDQIADVFYLRDLEGQKVEDEGRIREIEETLRQRLSKGQGTGRVNP
jgi:[protein-PII] uridylyltransferase